MAGVGRKPLGKHKSETMRMRVYVTKDLYQSVLDACLQYKDCLTKKGKPRPNAFIRKFLKRGIEAAALRAKSRRIYQKVREKREQRDREIEIAIMRGKPMPEEKNA